MHNVSLSHAAEIHKNIEELINEQNNERNYENSESISNIIKLNERFEAALKEEKNK
ncbi:hypothetical protein P5491_012845 [Priestia megaterium]|uniref:Uncharacterized protein n=1 Tax=Priestia megaterium TaxID=1404 RepID=A0ABD4X135_PRIMG|nr:hypothetical protein [Priestia megaterium]MDD9785886.1 hypothetical protein [Priestia megaterium]MDH3141988.1 hypothetical protein [Priestia megaterium]